MDGIGEYSCKIPSKWCVNNIVNVVGLVTDITISFSSIEAVVFPCMSAVMSKVAGCFQLFIMFMTSDIDATCLIFLTYRRSVYILIIIVKIL